MGTNNKMLKKYQQIEIMNWIIKIADNFYIKLVN